MPSQNQELFGSRVHVLWGSQLSRRVNVLWIGILDLCAVKGSAAVESDSVMDVIHTVAISNACISDWVEGRNGICASSTDWKSTNPTIMAFENKSKVLQGTGTGAICEPGMAAMRIGVPALLERVSKTIGIVETHGEPPTQFRAMSTRSRVVRVSCKVVDHGKPAKDIGWNAGMVYFGHHTNQVRSTTLGIQNYLVHSNGTLAGIGSFFETPTVQPPPLFKSNSGSHVATKSLSDHSQASRKVIRESPTSNQQLPYSRKVGTEDLHPRSEYLVLRTTNKAGLRRYWQDDNSQQSACYLEPGEQPKGQFRRRLTGLPAYRVGPNHSVGFENVTTPSVVSGYGRVRVWIMRPRSFTPRGVVHLRSFKAITVLRTVKSQLKLPECNRRAAGIRIEDLVRRSTPIRESRWSRNSAFALRLFYYTWWKLSEGQRAITSERPAAGRFTWWTRTI